MATQSLTASSDAGSDGLEECWGCQLILGPNLVKPLQKRLAKGGFHMLDNSISKTIVSVPKFGWAAAKHDPQRFLCSALPGSNSKKPYSSVWHQNFCDHRIGSLGPEGFGVSCSAVATYPPLFAQQLPCLTVSPVAAVWAGEAARLQAGSKPDRRQGGTARTRSRLCCPVLRQKTGEQSFF